MINLQVIYFILVNILVNKPDIDEKLINIDNKITSNKTKHIEAVKKLTDLEKKLHKYQKKKGYDLMLDRMYFTGNMVIKIF